MKNCNFLEICNNNPEFANDMLNGKGSVSWDQMEQLNSVPQVVPVVSSLCSKYINRVVCIRGNVIKAYPVYFKKVIGQLTCYKCNEGRKLDEREMKKQNFICDSCGNSSVKIEEIFTDAIPIQSIRIQDIGTFNAISETVEVLLEEENANKFHCGNKVDVLGIVVRKWRTFKKNEPMGCILCLKALNIVKRESLGSSAVDLEPILSDYGSKNETAKRKLLVDSFCREIVGNEETKLGILMCLACNPNLNIGETTRTNSHVLIIGEPSTGKTRMLKSAAKLISPAILTNGISTTDAGLTSCATKQGKEWVLEAGALVLSDLGICLIDEFNRLKVNEKGGLLEAMEQQTISVAKAGIVTTMNTRCSVIAACSSKYSYNSNRTVSENLDISTPLVSRFDLIFNITDRPNENKDQKKADFILKRSFEKKKTVSRHFWDQNVLKAFILHGRLASVAFSEFSYDILLQYYNKKREIEGPNEYNTIRMLESLIRIANSHAKLMLKDTITVDDEIFAILLLECTVNNNKNEFSNQEEFFTDQKLYELAKEKICKAFDLKVK
ncbi:hypothetical protein NUSPORA_00808 [Nucleospora cyclopteri]